MTDKSEIRLELSCNKRGIVLSGSRTAFFDLHEKLEKCWDCAGEMTREENLSYIGVISYFSYDIRHAFMGNRIVKLDGELVITWNDELFRLFEEQQGRFEISVEFPIPDFILIMSSWWECFRHVAAPVELLPVIRDWTEALERLLKSINPKQYPLIEPYLHGAVYAANPYLMHALEQISDDFRYAPRLSLKQLAEAFKITSFGSMEYIAFHKMLERQAKRLECRVAELTFNG